MTGLTVKVTTNIYGHEFETGEEILIVSKLESRNIFNGTEMWMCENSLGETWYLSEDEFEIM